MATGDQDDMAGRLAAVLPKGWFGGGSPVLGAVLGGLASLLSQVYGLVGYAKSQTRIAGATDGFLDLIAWDFFGVGLARQAAEADDAFRARILAGLFQPKATRAAVIEAVTALTGQDPVMFEPQRPADAFCLGYGGLGSGRLGSEAMPYQALLTVTRPVSAGIPLIAGLGSTYAGLGCGYLALASPDMIVGTIDDADIYAAVQAVKPAGTVIWMNLTTLTPPMLLEGGSHLLREDGGIILLET